jgi:hypothetical protein
VPEAGGQWVGTCTMIPNTGLVMMARTFLDAVSVAA